MLIYKKVNKYMGKRLKSVAAPATVIADEHLIYHWKIWEGRCKDEA